MNSSGYIKTHRLQIALLVIFLGGFSWFVSDLLFATPEIHEGTVLKMEFIEGKMQTSQYRLSRSRPQMISGASHDKWIATVLMKDGSQVLVDCKQHHFDNKKVGDVLRFKEFTGGTLEIKYFAHSEDQ